MALEDLEPEQTPDETIDQNVVDGLESTVGSDEPEQSGTPQADDSSYDAREQELYELRRMNHESQQRLGMLENFLTKIANRDQQPQPEPEIDFDDPASVLKAADRLMDRKLTHLQQQQEAQYRAIQEREFNQTVKEVNSESPEIVKRYRGEIDEYYRNNPEQRLNPESYRTVVTYLKGTLYDEQQKKRRASVSSPNPAPPRGVPPAKPEKFEYSPEQERLARIYGMLSGKDIIDPEEWDAVANDRRKFPGRRGGNVR